MSASSAARAPDTASGQPVVLPPRVGVFGASGEPGRASDEAEVPRGSGSGGASAGEASASRGVAHSESDGGACSAAAAEARGEEDGEEAADASRSRPAMRGLRRSAPVTALRIVKPESSSASENCAMPHSRSAAVNSPYDSTPRWPPALLHAFLRTAVAAGRASATFLGF